MNPKPSFLGHRERLRKKFMKKGLDSFLPHEILEILLTYSIPRKYTKPIAWALLKKFGSLSDVFELLFRDDFDFVQPYYGWDGFDEVAFNDRLYDLLSEIEYEPTQEDDDTNESLKEQTTS